MRMSPSQPAPPGRAEPVVQAALVAACFSLLLAGSNAFCPLLPVYRDRLGLDPLVLSLTFTLYVAALVVVLFTLARPRFTRHAAPLLLASLTMMITSDLGRAVAGIAGGLGTGAASALVVAAIGDPGDQRSCAWARRARQPSQHLPPCHRPGQRFLSSWLPSR